MSATIYRNEGRAKDKAQRLTNRTGRKHEVVQSQNGFQVTDYLPPKRQPPAEDTRHSAELMACLAIVAMRHRRANCTIGGRHEKHNADQEGPAANGQGQAQPNAGGVATSAA